jgi:hypothetical protein
MGNKKKLFLLYGEIIKNYFSMAVLFLLWRNNAALKIILFL